MQKPLISIVIPCYNDHEFIRQAVECANAQTYENKEVIVVDDGSDLLTKKILKELSEQIHLLITQDNSGLSAARNNGIKSANGEFILVWDSDDYFEPSFCEKAIAVFLESAGFYKIVTCKARRFNNSGTLNFYTPGGGNIENFLFSNSAIGNSMFKKGNWEKIGGYDEQMREGYEDWEFYIRLLKNGGEAFVIKEHLFNYRQKRFSLRREADKKQFQIMEYIFLKHADLYKDHFERYTRYFIYILKKERRERIKDSLKQEFVIGSFFLKPFRYVKSVFR